MVFAEGAEQYLRRAVLVFAEDIFVDPQPGSMIVACTRNAARSSELLHGIVLSAHSSAILAGLVGYKMPYFTEKNSTERLGSLLHIAPPSPI